MLETFGLISVPCFIHFEAASHGNRPNKAEVLRTVGAGNRRLTCEREGGEVLSEFIFRRKLRCEIVAKCQPICVVIYYNQ